MATVRILNNILEDKVDTFSVNTGLTVEQLIKEHTDGNSYEGQMVECYDLETGETYFAAIEDDTAVTNAIVQVNGNDVGLDYELQENDIVSVIITPAGGDNVGFAAAISGFFSGALTGAAIGFFMTGGNPIGALVGGIIGGFAGLIAGTLMAEMLRSDEIKSSKSGLDSSQLPDTRGAQNQPLTDQPFPMVLGKHLTTPFIIGSPWNEVKGDRGQENYIHVLYAVGYAPLRVSDFKLGEMFLAHNQSWSKNRKMKNVYNGTLSGIDNGDGSDELTVYQEYTTIDLYHRPQISASVMRAAGWTDIEDDEVATVYSSGYSNSSETVTVLVTPILSSGTVLTPAQLENYANKLLNNEAIDVDILLRRFEGNDSVSQSNSYGEALHEAQQAYYSDGATGDIVNTWKNNEITLEILQQEQNSGAGVNYGLNYPYAKIQEDVKANVLYIADGSLQEIASANSISYKGLGLENGLRNNPIRFSEQYARSLKVELDFSQGLYKTRSETDDDESEVKYYRIPMWVAIQWRVYSKDNEPCDGEKPGTDIPLPEWDSEKEVYKTVKVYSDKPAAHFRGWNTFTRINNIDTSEFTTEARNSDIDAHTGNKLSKEKTVSYQEWVPASGNVPGHYETKYRTGKEYTNINADWIGQQLFNLQPLGGTNSDKEGINEIRCVSQVNLLDWARANLLTEEERQSENTGTILAKKFRAYFYGSSNTTKSIEVRVVRISPCYLDETKSTKEHSAYKFTDVFTWATLTSEMLDGDKLIAANPEIVYKRPLEREIMRKLCVVALRAKSDKVDQLSNTLKKFTCIAQSFAPYYNDTEKKWFPESISTVMNYYGPVQNGIRASISREQFLTYRQNGEKAICLPGGNDYLQKMDAVIRTQSHYDSQSRIIIPDDDGTLNYCTNNVASMFLLAAVGPHLGKDALGYNQSFYKNGRYTDELGDINMPALAKWYKWAENVKDGTKYPSNGYYFDHNGNSVYHQAEEPVSTYFAANAYIYQTQTLEAMLSKISIAGRAVYTRDDKNRLTVVIDKEEEFPVALINQQNTLKSSYKISYAQNPSGLQITFPDENDGYNKNPFYVMSDGENVNKPTGAIEQYNFDYVTNNQQMYSLGRYLLANRILNKEVVTKQLGMEGASIGLGRLVVLQDDTMLIGTDSGGRITELIETEGLIYGFMIDNTYHYTGEEESFIDSDGKTKYRCKQGVVVMQPMQYQESRVITIRLAQKNTRRNVNGKTYQIKKGNTNLVLFDKAISKIDGYQTQEASEYYVYKPEVDNIVGFGYIGQMTATYRVIGIQPDENRHYDFTLAKYQENLYSYGGVLPSFQNNMTIPDRSKEDMFALSTNVTIMDLVKTLAEASEQAQGRIDDTFGNIPPVPSKLTADVSEACIQLRCQVDSDKVMNIDHIVYEITKFRLADNEDGYESLVVTMNGSYSTEYYFDRRWEGFPEKKAAGVVDNDGSLDFWLVRAKAVSIYKADDGTRIEGPWSDYINLSKSSLSAYGTWIPSKVFINSFVAKEEGIDAAWTCDLSKVYGTVQFEVQFYYEGNVVGKQTVPQRYATYQFNRATDGFPEKPGTVNMIIGTRTLDKYSVKVFVRNYTSGKSSESNPFVCNYDSYKTWIPGTPKISPRVVNRNITLHLSQPTDCYGLVAYLVGIKRYSDLGDSFFVPDLETNPYSRETAYKLFNGSDFVLGHIESDSQFTQTVPLETQNGIQAIIDHDESEADNRLIALNEEQDNKLLAVPIGGFAPIDTPYIYEVYAYNKTVEDYYDQTVSEHNYNKATYHKVSSKSATKNVIALATSVMDVLNASIVSEKLSEGAVTETKIEDDAISTPKLQANAVTADKIYTYNLVTLNQGAHSISGFAPNPDTDAEFLKLIQRVKSFNKPDDPEYKTALDEMDATLKRRSNNFWVGLDTEHPEFYMGNVPVSQKAKESANYFHYYFDGEDSNLDIKLSSFIVTAVSSTVKGYFNVRNKTGTTKYIGANSFLQVNPETSRGIGETVEGFYAGGVFYEDEEHTKTIEPDKLLVYADKSGASSSADYRYYQWKETGYYEVQSTDSETMLLKGDFIIGSKNSNNNGGKFTVTSGLTHLNGGLQVGTDSSGNHKGTCLYGSLMVCDETTLNNTLKVPNGLTSLTSLNVGNSTDTNNTTHATQLFGPLTVGVNQNGKKQNTNLNGNVCVHGDISAVDTNCNYYTGCFGNVRVCKDLTVCDDSYLKCIWTSCYACFGGETKINYLTGICGNAVYIGGSNCCVNLSVCGNIHTLCQLHGDIVSGRHFRVPDTKPENPQRGDMWMA